MLKQAYQPRVLHVLLVSTCLQHPLMVPMEHQKELVPLAHQVLIAMRVILSSLRTVNLDNTLAMEQLLRMIAMTVQLDGSVRHQDHYPLHVLPMSSPWQDPQHVRNVKLEWTVLLMELLLIVHQESIVQEV